MNCFIQFWSQFAKSSQTPNRLTLIQRFNIAECDSLPMYLGNQQHSAIRRETTTILGKPINTWKIKSNVEYSLIQAHFELFVWICSNLLKIVLWNKNVLFSRALLFEMLILYLRNSIDLRLIRTIAIVRGDSKILLQKKVAWKKIKRTHCLCETIWQWCQSESG